MPVLPREPGEQRRLSLGCVLVAQPAMIVLESQRRKALRKEVK
jgi:hypothetical protein